MSHHSNAPSTFFHRWLQHAPAPQPRKPIESHWHSRLWPLLLASVWPNPNAHKVFNQPATSTKNKRDHDHQGTAPAGMGDKEPNTASRTARPRRCPSKLLAIKSILATYPLPSGWLGADASTSITSTSSTANLASTAAFSRARSPGSTGNCHAYDAGPFGFPSYSTSMPKSFLSCALNWSAFWNSCWCCISTTPTKRSMAVAATMALLSTWPPQNCRVVNLPQTLWRLQDNACSGQPLVTDHNYGKQVIYSCNNDFP